MAQLRRDQHLFEERRAAVVVIGPDAPDAFRAYWAKHDLPFIGLPDPDHTVSNRYGQRVAILKLGRMPAQAVVDMAGRLRFLHHGRSMRDIPPNSEILALLDRLDTPIPDEPRD